MSRTLFTLLLISLLAASCLPAPVTVPPSPIARTETPPSADIPLQHITFTPSAADIPNPERGFYEGVELGETDLTWRPAETGNHLLYLNARLDDYRDRDLTDEYLAELEDFFIAARQAGLKTIVRFSYNDGETYPAPAPDASLEQVLRHIEQLAPVLEVNKDVIAWFEAGFIGAIGLDATEAGRQLLLTQTDKEVAANQRATFQQQQQAPLLEQVRAAGAVDETGNFQHARVAGERLQAQILDGAEHHAEQGHHHAFRLSPPSLRGPPRDMGPPHRSPARSVTRIFGGDRRKRDLLPASP